MFTTPLFNAPIATAATAAVSISQPSESDIRGIFAALQNDSMMSAEQKKVVMAAITEKIGAVSIITALISPTVASSPSTPAISSTTTIQEDSESLVEEEQEEQEEEQEEHEEQRAAEGSLEEVDEVLNIKSAKQFPALPKARRAPSPIRDPIREARANEVSPPVHFQEEECAHHSHEDHEEDESREVEFKNEPEPCYHFFKYGILSANKGTKLNGYGCRYGTDCAKSHGHVTRLGRSISARTQAQIENGSIVCFRCEGPHHVDDCHCEHCGSERHISIKCARCYNCGERGHMIRECPESPRESESPRERGVRVVYGTPRNWKY